MEKELIVKTVDDLDKVEKLRNTTIKVSKSFMKTRKWCTLDDPQESNIAYLFVLAEENNLKIQFVD